MHKQVLYLKWSLCYVSYCICYSRLLINKEGGKIEMIYIVCERAPLSCPWNCIFDWSLTGLIERLNSLFTNITLSHANKHYSDNFFAFFFFIKKLDSMGHDIPKMLQLFREGLEYMVEGERLIKTRIARVSCI